MRLIILTLIYSLRNEDPNSISLSPFLCFFVFIYLHHSVSLSFPSSLFLSSSEIGQIPPEGYALTAVDYQSR